MLAPAGHPAAQPHGGPRRRSCAARRTGACAWQWAVRLVVRRLGVRRARSRPSGARVEAAWGAVTSSSARRCSAAGAVARPQRQPGAPCAARRRCAGAAAPTVPSASSWGPTTSATRAPERSADLIWDFMERPSNARSARSPARRSWAVSASGRLPAGRVDDVGVQGRPRGGSAEKTPSASQASSTRSIPMPNPMPGVGCRRAARPGRRSGRRRRCRSGPPRARRRRTRTWCGCSSRSRAPGGGR